MLLDNNEANHLFFFLLQTGLARCADRLPFLKELEECSQYLQPWSFWSSSPSTSRVPKIAAMLCQTKHADIVFYPLSGLKQSTSKEAGVSWHLRPSLLSNNRNVQPVSMTFIVIPSRSFGFLSSKFLNKHFTSVSCVSTLGKFTTQFRS